LDFGVSDEESTYLFHGPLPEVHSSLQLIIHV